MNKIKIITLLSAVILGSNAYAGMHMPTNNSSQNHGFFATLETGYTWNSIGNTTISGVNASKSDEGWSGRGAIGATHWVCNNLGYTGEMGWGYYGKTTFSSAATGVTAENQMYGLDLLVGPDYRFDQFDLSLKVGGMIENVRANRTADQSKVVGGGSSVGITKSRLTHTFVTPEIKVGAAYNFDDQWALSVSYMYAFGNNVSTNISRSITDPGPVTITSNNSITGGPVALSTLTVGLRYSFA